MVYLTVIFLIFSLILIYKNLNQLSTWFFLGIVISWILSVISLILYLSKHSYYYKIVNNIFSLSPQIWNALIAMNFSIYMSITLLNIGIISFIYFLLCYAISLSNRKKKKYSNRKKFILLAIVPLLEIIFYDPQIYQLIYNFLAYSPNFKIGYDQIVNLYNIVHLIFKCANFLYLAFTIYIIIMCYKNYPNVKFLRRYILFNTFCLLPIVVINALLFFWAPRMLIKATAFKDYFIFVNPDLDEYVLLFNYFPYIIFVALAFMVYSIYKYNAIETYYKDKDIHIHTSIDTAKLGLRVFTHSFKNYILAIQFEAEFLKERYSADQDAQKSLNLILSSCNKAFDNIAKASSKLQTINLDMQPLRLDIPIEKTITRISLKNSSAEIKVEYGNEIPIAYIDEHHLSEALYNIIKNAIEAIEKSNRTDGLIEIKVTEQNQWGIISITDNGPGISDEFLDNIFIPFFSTKSSVENWGIGLPYCHKIISAHGGEINVQSNKDVGTTFRILIPIL